jgi:hypothetical protein
VLDLGLPQRIAAKGVPVEFVPGWETRSAGSYNPRGALFHHTAGSASGRAPSLGIVTYGRSDLPGPLAQGLQTRESDGWDHFIAVAAGRANHAGSGGWNGLTGNSTVAGLEVEHVGTGPVASDRLEVGARIVAAMLEAPGSTGNAAYACQHFEWTSRKIDFYNLAPHFNTASFRQRVAFWIGRTVHTAPPTPIPKPDEEEDMRQRVIAVAGDNTFHWMALGHGFVQKFNAWPLPGLEPGEHWCPNSEYHSGVAAKTLFPVEFVDVATYNNERARALYRCAPVSDIQLAKAVTDVDVDLAAVDADIARLLELNTEEPPPLVPGP